MKNKKIEEFDNLELFQWFFEIKRIGNKAVKEAREENRRLNLPECFVKNGKLYYAYADGTVTDKKPAIYTK